MTLPAPMAIDSIGCEAAEPALHDSQRRLRLITEKLPALVAYIDADERYRFLNAQLARVLGVDVDATLGKTLREVRGAAAYAGLAAHVAAALRGEPVEFAHAESIAGRALHYRSSYLPDIDAAGRVAGFYAMTFDITELHETRRQLELLARVDPLTGLPNRRQFDERLRDAMRRSRRTMRPVAVMFLDIDHFEAINDAHGHAGGDAVLREFARRLGERVRATDLVARLAGDEFGVVLEGIDGVLEVGRVAEKIVGSIRPRFDLGDATLAVTTSAGVAIYRGAEQSAADVLALADAALCRAKQQGRDRFALA